MKPRWESLDAAALEQQAGVLDALYDDALDAVVVRGLFDASWMDTVHARLDDPGEIFDAALLGKFLGNPTLSTIGTPISRFGVGDYFEAARLFHAGCERLFAGGPDYEGTVYTALRALGGAPVRRAEDSAGQRFGGWNIRIVPPGAEIGQHHGLSFFEWPGYAALGESFDRRTQLSFYVVIAAPEAGGALEITPKQGGPALPFALAPGEMIVFDEGRHPHRVDHVRGEKRRVTIGGFLGRASAGDGWLNWA